MTLVLAICFSLEFLTLIVVRWDFWIPAIPTLGIWLLLPESLNLQRAIQGAASSRPGNRPEGALRIDVAAIALLLGLATLAHFCARPIPLSTRIEKFESAWNAGDDSTRESMASGHWSGSSPPERLEGRRWIDAGDLQVIDYPKGERIWVVRWRLSENEWALDRMGWRDEEW